MSNQKVSKVPTLAQLALIQKKEAAKVEKERKEKQREENKALLESFELSKKEAAIAQDEIRAQIKVLRALLIKKVDTDTNILAKKNKASLVKSINEQLCTLKKVYTIALKELKHYDSEELILTILTDSKKKKFNYSQFCELIKSHNLIKKVSKCELQNDDYISVNAYIDLILNSSCLIPKAYQLRKRGK